MAFNPINFMQAPILRDDRVSSFADNLLKGLTAGFSMRQQAEQEKRAQQAFDVQQEMLRRQMQAQERAEEESRDPLHKINALTQSLRQSNIPQQQQQALINQAIYGSALTPEQVQQYELKKMGIKHEYDVDLLNKKANQELKAELAAGGKNIEYLKKAVIENNPQIPKEKASEAIDAYVEGKPQLKDGTLLNPMNTVTNSAFSVLGKSVTDASTRNQINKTRLAKAAVPVLNDYINKALDKYGTSLKGMTAKRFSEYFDNSEQAQKDKGEYLAAQQLLFDQAQDFIRLAGANPSVKLTNQLMHESALRMGVEVGTLSPTARKAFSDYLTKALKASGEAMEKVKTGGSSFILKSDHSDGEEEAPEEWEMVLPVKNPDGSWSLPS